MSDVKILVVDDEVDILEMLAYNLKKEGFSPLIATSGEQALEIYKEHNPAVILLDIMMTGLDGVETCRRIRQLPGGSNPFVIFLTARAEEYSQIAGFDAGADDYIPKPIKPMVLIRKIKAMLQRRKPSDDDLLKSELKIGILRILPEEYLVYLEENPISLRKKEFELLFFLASQPGKVFSREVLLEKVWGANVHVVDRTIDVHVRKLREKIGKDWIQTVQGVGYKFKSIK